MSKQPKKFNKCPHCKTNKGFKVVIYLGGYQEEERSFKGEVLKVDRHGADDTQETVECLNCGKSIPLENVRVD